MWEYNEKVREHFLNPRNVGTLENPDGVGDVGSISCGDALKLYIKVDENRVITDAKFKTYGCASAIASSSIMTEMIIGKTIEEAVKITNMDVVNKLGGLPEEKIHCSVMCREALDAAIADYQGAPPVSSKDKNIVCECYGITKNAILRAVTQNNLSQVEEVTNRVKAGGGCGSCVEKIQEIILEAQKSMEAEVEAPKPQKPKLTNIQKIALIQETIDNEIRPSLKKDGGDIELIDVDGRKVIVALRGACSNCPSSGITLRYSVEQKLKEFVSDDLQVVEAEE